MKSLKNKYKIIILVVIGVAGLLIAQFFYYRYENLKEHDEAITKQLEVYENYERLSDTDLINTDRLILGLQHSEFQANFLKNNDLNIVNSNNLCNKKLLLIPKGACLDCIIKVIDIFIRRSNGNDEYRILIEYSSLSTFKIMMNTLHISNAFCVKLTEGSAFSNSQNLWLFSYNEKMVITKIYPLFKNEIDRDRAIIENF
jgi:hypothetical protein